jgi:diguanylate cyclase (GGDEF)-like protein
MALPQRRVEGVVAPRDRARLLVLALLAVHVAAAAGPAVLRAPWAAAYALPVLAAAALFPGWWPATALWAGAVLLEAGDLGLRVLFAGADGAAPRAWAALAVAAALLGALLVLACWLFRAAHRERASLRAALDEHRRLRDEAEGFRARADERREPEPASLSHRAKETRIMSAVVDLDRDLERLLGLARLATGARTVFLFLLAEDGARLPLRAAAGGGEGAEPDREAALRLGEGVIGHAAKTRRPALFTNLEPGSLRPPLYADATPSPSVVVVPVVEQGVFRGVIVADAADPGAFERAQEEVLAGFSREVAAVLENARTKALRERRSHRVETLRYITQALSATIKLDEMLAKMVDLTREIVPYDRCALFLADPEGRRLLLRAERGFGAGRAEETAVPFDHGGLPGFIALHRRSLLFSNLKERRRAVEIVPGAPGQERIRSFLGVPIQHQEGLVGVWVLVADEPGRFDAEHLDMLSVVATQAAILITNAALHQTVERMAVTDGLTGLYNHRHFQERLGHEVERVGRGGEPVSLLLLDIDHFKKINDAHGHPFGDRVIRALAAELQRIARRVDFTARYGGEEFAVILVGTDRRGCRTTAQRVLKAVRALRIPQEAGAFSFTVSVGAATCPGDAATREELVRCADQALYAAKEGGRNRAMAFEEVRRP